MAEKITDELLHEIKSATDVEDYLADNRAELLQRSLAEALAQLLKEKCRTKADVLRTSNMDKAYLYQIFSGSKTPSRDKLLLIAFGLTLNLSETQRLLKLAGYRELYARDSRDAVLLFCLERDGKLLDVNAKLYELGLEPLT